MRFQTAIVKPDELEKTAKERAEEANRPLAELQAESRTLNEKERAIGLIAAPVAAAITLIVVPTLASYDVKHASTYVSLLLVQLAMTVLIMITALLRKRMFLGMVLALYGLALFNLHQWGFAIPFLLAGAWYLVRAYRLSQSIKLAGGTGSGRGAYKPRERGLPSAGGTLPRPNKRYTPPTAPVKRPGKTQREPNPS